MLSLNETISTLEKTLVGNIVLDDENDPKQAQAHLFRFKELERLLNLAIEARQSGDTLSYMILKIQETGMSLDLFTQCTDLAATKANYAFNIKLHQQAIAALKLQQACSDTLSVSTTDLFKCLDNLKATIDDIEARTREELKTTEPEKIQLISEADDPGAYIPTGFDTIDDALNDLGPGQVTLIAGRSHEGKSTFVRQIIANAINKRRSVLWVVGESTLEAELQNLYEIVIGRNEQYYQAVKVNRVYLKQPKSEVRTALNRWHKNKLWMLSKAEAKLKNTNELLTTIAREIRIRKPRLVIVDNLMSVLSASAVEKNEAQAAFMQDLCDLARIHNCHVALVLHPNKLYRQGDRMAYEHISGSSDLVNKADNLLIVRKASEDELEKGIDGHIDIEKNRHRGRLVSINTKFDIHTRGLAEIKDGRAQIKAFDISKYFDKELNFYNGTKQIIEPGNGW